MKPGVVLAILFMIVFAAAATEHAEKAGDIVSTVGIVKSYEPGSPRGVAVDATPAPLFNGAIVKTFRDASARISFIDDTRVILDEYAVLEIEDIRSMGVDGGTVIFDVKKRGRARGLNIRTKTAVIGVKGTRFAVSMPDNDTVNVFLKSGSIVCEAVEGQFKRYVEKQEDEFEDFMKDQQDGFDQYRSELEKEFIEYVESFEMKPNMAVSMSGNEVRNIEIPDSIEDAFRELDEAF